VPNGADISQRISFSPTLTAFLSFFFESQNPSRRSPKSLSKPCYLGCMGHRNSYKFVQGWAISENAKVSANLSVCVHPHGGWTVRETLPNSAISMYRGSFASREAAEAELKLVRENRLMALLRGTRGHEPVAAPNAQMGLPGV